MSKILKSLILLSLSIAGIHSAAAACRSSDISVRQTRTGRIIEGKPEYEVDLSNLCSCQQSAVVVRCYGLSSVEPVDPRSIKPVDEERCLVGGGRPIAPGSRVRFRYAWLTPQDFPLIGSRIHC